MTERLRPAAALLALLVLAGCSRTPPGGAVAYGIPYPAQVVTSNGSSTSGGGTSTPTASAATPSPAPGGATGSGAAALAAALGINTRVAPTASWAGVTPTAIKIAFAGKLHNCDENSGASNASTGTWTQKYADVIKAYIEYFNKYIPLPGGRHLQLVGNDTTFGIPLVDEGGQYCPNKQQAAGRYIASSLRPFATMVADPQGIHLGQPIAAAHLLTLTPFATVAEMRSYYPYAWSTGGNPEDQVRYLSYLVAKRLVHTQYVDSSGVSHPRVIGIVVDSDPLYDYLATKTLQDFAAVGINIPSNHLYRAPTTTTGQSQNGQQQALRLEQDGINTVVWENTQGYVDYFDSIHYYPDQLVTSPWCGLYMGAFPADQIPRFTAVGTPAIACARNDIEHFNSQPENGHGYQSVWAASKEYDGKTPDNGAAGYGIWVELSTLVVGLELSPVNFSPLTWSQGLILTDQAKWRCPVEQLFHADHPQTPQFVWTPQDPSGDGGYTTYYGTTKQSQLGTPGYWESYDGYYRFNGYNDLPASPRDDTGKDPNFQEVNQPFVGFSPFKSCASLGLRGDLYQ